MSAYQQIVSDIRVHGSILVMGAGASFESGLPLYAQFAPIVWQVIDEFPQIKESMMFDKTIPAKDIIGNDASIIKDAFNYIEKYSSSDNRFKELFIVINEKNKRLDLSVHSNICKLIHAGYIKLVVSFNWDDLLETAWENIYGTNINANKLNLIKPHGDVRNPTDKWTYPNSSGFLSAYCIETINKVTSNGSSTFVILGYSEQDAFIAETFIKPNEVKNVVYRISPSSQGKNAINATAREAMKQIVNRLNIGLDNELWSRVDFSNQRGIEHALLGYRLLPSDVNACPKLPAFSVGLKRLEQAHYVNIEGLSGSGKSSTLYSLAYSLMQSGREVLKLNTSKTTNSKVNIPLNNDGYNTIYIIDDAQLLKEEQIVNLMIKANDINKLIVAQTITTKFSSESIIISQEESIEALYKYYKKNKHIIFPIVKKLNEPSTRQVGDRFGEVSYEYALASARKEKTPWLFNYSLRGGWNNTRNQYAMAKDHYRADILLLLISLKQIITLDKPIAQSWLIDILYDWGYDAEWLAGQLKYLVESQCILNSPELRSLHLEMAIRIIANFVKQSTEDDLQKFKKLLQDELLNEDNPLLGIHWFFDLFSRFHEKHKLTYNLFSDGLMQGLLFRCKKQNSSEGRAHAGFVIDRVLCTEARNNYSTLTYNDDFLVSWIENVDNRTAYSYSQILNSMINERKTVHKDFVDRLNPDNIIANLKNIDSDSLYVWSSFLNRLLFNMKSKWSKNFCKKFPQNDISLVIQKCPIKHVGSLCDLLCTLSIIDEKFAFDEFHKALWIIKDSLENDFVYTLENIDLHFLMCILGENLFDLGKPNQKQKDAGKAFVDCISSEMIKKCLFEGVPKNWETLYRFSHEIYRYDSERIQNAVKDVSFNTMLAEETDTLWEEQPRELILLIYMLVMGDVDTTENWIFSNKSKLKNICPELTQFSPRTAESVIQSGGNVELMSGHQRSINANAIESLYSYNKKLCQELVYENLAPIKQSLYDLSKIEWEDYHLFLKQLLKVRKSLFNEIFSDMDIPLIQEVWNEKLSVPFYKHDKKDLKGFKKIITMIQQNTNNPTFVETLVVFNQKIDDIIDGLKLFTR